MSLADYVDNASRSGDDGFVHACFKGSRRTFCDLWSGFAWSTDVEDLTCPECRRLWERGCILEDGQRGTLTVKLDPPPTHGPLSVQAGTKRESENESEN